MNYKIIDNFLSEKEFLKIKNILLNNDNFPWYFNSCVSKENAKDGFYFTHCFYLDTIQSDFFDILKPIIDIIKPKTLKRVKANLYTKTFNLFEHDPHVDYKYEHKGFIYYINNNDGLTILNDSVKIESIENRGLFFDPHLFHRSTTCTDKNARININFNYF
jgi:hypothetical protein